MRNDMNAFFFRLGQLTPADVEKLEKEAEIVAVMDNVINEALEHAAMASGTGAHLLAEEDEASGANWEYAMQAQDLISAIMEDLPEEAGKVVYLAMSGVIMRSNIGNIFLQSDYNTLTGPFKNALGKVHPDDAD